MNQEQVIQEAIDIIYEKTGIPFDIHNVIVDWTDYFKKHKHWRGYYDHGEEVYVRPSLFDFNEQFYRDFYRRESFVHIICRPNGKIEPISEDEYVELQKQESIKSAQSTIIHEIGHWVHWVYFGYQPKYIRGRSKSKRGHDRKNGTENFATAFQQYCQGQLMITSARYKKMDEIVKEVKTTSRWVSDKMQEQTFFDED